MITKTQVRTYKEFGTQVERPKLWIDTRNDRVVTAQQYFTSEMWIVWREEAAHFIQKIVRGYFAETRTKNLEWKSKRKKKSRLSWKSNTE